MSSDGPTFREQLRAWRDRNGWKQAFAAGKLGVPLATYRNWERSKSEPRGVGRAAVLKTIQAP